MERLTDLALILKTIPYGERDLVVVFFSEHHGKLTAMAKGGIHSRRFGGALQSLVASRISWVKKESSEMGRIEEAVIHKEFPLIARDFERLTVASFMTELCSRVLESAAPSRDLFVILSHSLFHLDEGLPLHLILNAFLVKALQALGYSPQWEESSLEIDGQFLTRIVEALLVVPFRNLEQAEFADSKELLNRLLYFLFHHVPLLDTGGEMKSFKLLSEVLSFQRSDTKSRNLQ